MRIWFDTEFIEDGKTIDLISIGLIREDGLSLYMQNGECDFTKANDWVKENVIPLLSPEYSSKEDIAKNIVNFVGQHPVFWGYHSAYDWVVLCQLYGSMMNLPATWPMFCRDIKQLIGTGQLLPKPKDAHNALVDAIWTRECHLHHERTN